VGRYVHPADGLGSGAFVGLADDEIDIDGLADPVVEMAVVVDVEDFAAVAPAGSQIGVSALELYVDLFAAGLAVIIFELDFAVDSVVERPSPRGRWVGAPARLSVQSPWVLAFPSAGRWAVGDLRATGFQELV